MLTINGKSVLEDRVAIVTGAAQGLGEALAQRLSDEGMKVVVADINLEQAELVASKLKDAVAIKVDVTNYLECEEMAKLAIEKYGRLDVLISNAAILIAKSIDEFPSEQWHKVIEVNLVGFFNSVKAVAPFMMESKKGSIIQINSKSGKKGSFKNSAYSASKFGGIGLVQSLGLELAPFNVRINAICPGNLLDSPLWVNSLYEQYSNNLGITKEEVRKKYVDQVPLARGCQYEDVSNLMVYLASDQSSYMTGQALNVTGGQEMK